jgi:AraC-like DNA-binding protein/quercetin dioxygenase-like cupin family protein
MTLPGVEPGPMSIDVINDEHLLLWVERGTGVLRCDPETFRVSGGQAVWVPAGVRHRFDAAPDALCFPIAVPPRHVVTSRREPYLIAVPPGWRAWLIHQFTVAISPLRSVGPPGGGLGDLLRVGAGVTPPDVVLPLPRTQLRQPTTPVLGTITQHLMRDPARPSSATEWARQARISPRTLQRWFLAEVGVTFEKWRTACRLLASTEYLVAGYPVGWVAHRVGFQSTSGFARAFAGEFGLTPRSYAALAPDARGNRRPRRIDGDAAIMELLAGDARPASGVRDIPASSTPPLVNNFHVIIWMYRGRCRAHIGPRTFDLDTGDAIWLPAGIPNRVDVDVDSIMMPIQSSPPPTRLTADDVRVIPLPGRDELALLRAAVAQYTWLRPPRYDELAGWYAFEHSVTGHGATDHDGMDHEATDRGAGTVAPAQADAANQATMETARRLLAGGLRPSAVAERLGYRHLSSFSRAFTRMYGASPRAFQRHRSGAAFPPATIGR